MSLSDVARFARICQNSWTVVLMVWRTAELPQTVDSVDNSKLDLFDKHHERFLTVEVIFRHLLYCRYVERKLVEVWVDHQYTKELGLDSSFSPCCTEFAFAWH